MNFISQPEVDFLAKGNDKYRGKVASKNNLYSLFFPIPFSLLLQTIKRTIFSKRRGTKCDSIM